MDIEVTEKQNLFIEAEAFEVLFGGAAGGGKSHGQLIDALLYALQYPKSSQIIFRSTFSDLEKSLIRKSRSIYPIKIADYNDSKHTWKFKNGSIIDFGYIQYDKDVYQYQSAEYDVIRFDELTHFTEFQYLYMISRCRGANPYPKHVKSSTNPGGVGHAWVKKRFIDIGEPNKMHKCRLSEDNPKESTRIFIPSLVQDNKFMLEYDPEYVDRLDALPEKERQALKYGDWDIFDGVFFSEFSRRIHVIEPFTIPEHWNRYISFDYGLDKFAVLFIAIDEKGKAYVYNYIHKEGLLASEAAQTLKSYMRKDTFRDIFAPTDLWATDRHTGKSTAEIFSENGVDLTQASRQREIGWLAIKEWIKPIKTRHEQTGEEKITSNMVIFENVLPLIEYLPMIQRDEKNPNDCAVEPHELTHICDALRYFCIMHTDKTPEPPKPRESYYIYEKPIHKDYGDEIQVL